MEVAGGVSNGVAAAAAAVAVAAAVALGFLACAFRALPLEKSPAFDRCGGSACTGGRVVEPAGVMWPIFWASIRTYAPYVTFPIAFVVGVVGYNLEWFIRGKPPPQTPEDEKSISERREDRKLQESVGKDLTQVVSLKEKLEFAPKAVLNRNRPEKN